MSAEFVGLAILMAAVTYPSRAIPLLVPGVERLRPRLLEFLELVGPACLAALVAVNTFLVTDEQRHASFHVGIEWPAVALCVAVGLRFRSVLPGVVAAVALAAVARLLNLA